VTSEVVSVVPNFVTFGQMFHVDAQAGYSTRSRGTGEGDAVALTTPLLTRTVFSTHVTSGFIRQLSVQIMPTHSSNYSAKRRTLSRDEMFDV
jgi:hypothetical protein